MIYKEATFDTFWHWLRTSSGYQNKFSAHGAKALWDYLENLAEDTDTNIKFDPIAWCCEFSEYDSLADFNADYNTANPFDTWGEVAENTTVIEFEMAGTSRALVGEF